MSMKTQTPSSLFWSWGAYVFLPVNFIIGTIISASGSSIEELLISSFIALTIMMFLAYPTVCLSSKYGKNYSQSVRFFIKKKNLVITLISLVPLISVGWYSIQTTMFVNLIQLYLEINNYIFILIIICMSYLFALGVTKFEYSWLKNVGIVGMLFLLIMFLTNINFNISIKFGFIRPTSVINYTIQILGTWVFSSVTCIMDITSHVKKAKKGFKYIVCATFLTNILLVILGYLINTDINSFAAFSVINFIALLVALWTTNDSNFYSIICSLEELGISKRKTVLCVPILSSVLSIVVVENFDLYLTRWLSLMSWIGVPIGIMWWVFYLKDREDRS